MNEVTEPMMPPRAQGQVVTDHSDVDWATHFLWWVPMGKESDALDLVTWFEVERVVSNLVLIGGVDWVPIEGGGRDLGGTVRFMWWRTYDRGGFTTEQIPSGAAWFEVHDPADWWVFNWVRVGWMVLLSVERSFSAAHVFWHMWVDKEVSGVSNSNPNVEPAVWFEVSL